MIRRDKDPLAIFDGTDASSQALGGKTPTNSSGANPARLPPGYNPNYPSTAPAPKRGLDPNFPGNLTRPAPKGPPAALPRPQGSAGAQLGGLVRSGVPVVGDAATSVLDAGSYVPRKVGGFVRDFTYGLVGTDNPNDGKPLPGIREGAQQFFDRPAAPAAQATAPGFLTRPAGGPATGRSPGPFTRPKIGQQDAKQTLRSADGKSQGYFIGSDGVRRTVNVDGTVNGKGAGTGSFFATGPETTPSGPNLNLYRPPAGNYAAPTFYAPSGPSQREREAVLSSLDTQLSRLGDLNTRGKRQLASEILSQKQAYITGNDNRNAENARAAMAANASGANMALDANARADTTAQTIGAEATQAALTRDFQRQYGGVQIPLPDGSLGLRRGDQVAIVTGPDGKPIREATPRLSPDAIYRAYADAMGNAFTPQERAAIDASPLGLAARALLPNATGEARK